MYKIIKIYNYFYKNTKIYTNIEENIYKIQIFLNFILF